VVADRLAQPAGAWKPFDAHGARRWFYKTTHHGPLAAAR